ASFLTIMHSATVVILDHSVAMVPTSTPDAPRQRRRALTLESRTNCAGQVNAQVDRTAEPRVRVIPRGTSVLAGEFGRMLPRSHTRPITGCERMRCDFCKNISTLEHFDRYRSGCAWNISCRAARVDEPAAT